MTPTRSVPWAGIWRAGIVAALVAAVANAVVFLVARGVGAMPSDVITPAGRPITLGPVLFLSIFPAIVAAALYGVLLRFTRRATPIFLAVAALVFIVYAVLPLGIEGAPTGMVIALELMHVFVALPVVALLLRAARSAPRPAS